MKNNRNDKCPCDSGKKYKNCCGKMGNDSTGKSKIVRKLVISAVGLFFALMIWAIVDFYAGDHAEMEAYKCDNPNCNRIHYRQKTETN